MIVEMGVFVMMLYEVQVDSGIGYLLLFIEVLKVQDEEMILLNGDRLSCELIGVIGMIIFWNWFIN